MELSNVAKIKLMEFILEDNFLRVENQDGVARVEFIEGRNCIMDRFGRVTWDDE